MNVHLDAMKKGAQKGTFIKYIWKDTNQGCTQTWLLSTKLCEFPFLLYFPRQIIFIRILLTKLFCFPVLNFRCPAEGCNRIFESHGGLKRHINKLHSKEHLKFHCPHCEQKFTKNKQLRFHIAKHLNQPPLR